MRPQLYSFQQLEVARVYLELPMYDKFGTLHLTPSQREWARRVVAFFKRLFDRMRKYHAVLNDWQLAVKGVWAEVKARVYALRNKWDKQAAESFNPTGQQVCRKRGSADLRTRRFNSVHGQQVKTASRNRPEAVKQAYADTNQI